MKASRNVACAKCAPKTVSQHPTPRYIGTTCTVCTQAIVYVGTLTPLRCTRCARESDVCAYCEKSDHY